MLLKLEDLKAWSGYEQPARVENWLREHGVKFWRGKDGEVKTTEAMINEALTRTDAPVEIDF